MTAILHISDPHFGTELPEVADALIRLANAQAPEVLIVSGDITQRARRSQFAAARDFMDSLQISRRLVIPGNHDIALFNLAERAFFPYRNFRRAFGQQLQPILTSDELLVITLDTTRRYRHVDGEVSLKQIERVETLLKNAGQGQLRIVVTHQPVSVRQAGDQQDLLHRHAQAIRRWTEAGVDLILGGHIHLPYMRALHEQYPDLSRPAWAVQAGTCISSRLRHEAGNSVNIIRYHGLQLHAAGGHTASAPSRHCVIERWDYQSGSANFENVSTCVVNRTAMGSTEHA